MEASRETLKHVRIQLIKLNYGGTKMREHVPFGDPNIIFIEYMIKC